MDLNDLVLISVDDHVVEPPDLFDGLLPAKYVDKAPKLVERSDGTQAWRYEKTETPNVGLNAVAGRPPEEYGMEPTTFDELRAGTWDVHQRVLDQSANGVLAGLNFPSFPRFAGQLFQENLNSDPEQGPTMARAYNDWHIDKWCGSYPDRFIPLAIPIIWDMDLLVAEVERVAAKGCHAMTFSANPYDLGYPSFHTDHWDRFWAACVANDVIVCMHLGSNSKIQGITAPDAPMTVQITQAGIQLFSCASDLIWSRVFMKFPDLKIAMSEGGIGWIPYLTERLDYVYKHHRAWTGSDFGDLLPSDIFYRNIITCFIDDKFGVESRGHLNLDHITWECDYPHSDSTWPWAPEELLKSFEGVSDEDINKITHENAMRLFKFDPYAIRPRERCTVRALREEAKGHDTSIVAKGKKEHLTTVGVFNTDFTAVKS